MENENGIVWTNAMRLLEHEIYPGKHRKSKRIHIADLHLAWATYLKTLEKPVPWWRRAWGWIRRAV